MWYFYLIMKMPESAVLNAWTCLNTKKKRQQAKVTQMTYYKVVNYLLSSYKADDDKAGEDAELTTSKQKLNMDAVEYSRFSIA